jgi:Phage XkdN-like tail assembly chaperone protein, TAC
MASTEQEHREIGDAAHEQMEAAQDARLVDGPEVAETYTGTPDTVETAAQSVNAVKNMSGEQTLDAMEWLLSGDPWGGATPKATYEVNVGTDEEPRLVMWTIRPVDADEMNALRQEARQSAGNRAQRRGRVQQQSGDLDFDVVMFNKRLVALATIDPDLQQAARERGAEAADPLLGPTTLLTQMFRHKPGLLDQLAGHVMRFSGFDEDDVARATTPEATMVKAAGN